LRIDYSFTAQKVGKQFQAADNAKARFSIVVGAEYPTLTLQNMRTRFKSEVQAETLEEKLREALAEPEVGVLLA
jgi:histidyl-tRNA synthetase